MKRGLGARRWGRRLTAGARALPHFLVLGAMKSGTGPFYSYLCAHPSVRPALVKEVHYFDRHVDRGERWYRSHFPLGRPGLVTGEASPSYLLHPAAPAHAFDLVPDARLLVILRNPVDRAFSHFQHTRARGFEPVADFGEALALEPSRTDEAWARLLRTGRSDPDRPVERFGYVRRGRYGAQLERWTSVYPEEALLVVTSDELRADPRGVMERCHAHLGLTGEVVLPPTAPSKGRTYERMDDDVRVHLTEVFREDVEALEARLGRPTGWL